MATYKNVQITGLGIRFVNETDTINADGKPTKVENFELTCNPIKSRVLFTLDGEETNWSNANHIYSNETPNTNFICNEGAPTVKEKLLAERQGQTITPQELDYWNRLNWIQDNVYGWYLDRDGRETKIADQEQFSLYPGDNVLKFKGTPMEFPKAHFVYGIGSTDEGEDITDPVMFDPRDPSGTITLPSVQDTAKPGYANGTWMPELNDIPPKTINDPTFADDVFFYYNYEITAETTITYMYDFDSTVPAARRSEVTATYECSNPIAVDEYVNGYDYEAAKATYFKEFSDLCATVVPSELPPMAEGDKISSIITYGVKESVYEETMDWAGMAKLWLKYTGSSDDTPYSPPEIPGGLGGSRLVTVRNGQRYDGTWNYFGSTSIELPASELTTIHDDDSGIDIQVEITGWVDVDTDIQYNCGDQYALDAGDPSIPGSESAHKLIDSIDPTTGEPIWDNYTGSETVRNLKASYRIVSPT